MSQSCSLPSSRSNVSALFTAFDTMRVKWNGETWQVVIIAVYMHDGRFSVHFELNGSRQFSGIVSVWRCETGDVLTAIGAYLRRSHRQLAHA